MNDASTLWDQKDASVKKNEKIWFDCSHSNKKIFLFSHGISVSWLCDPLQCSECFNFTCKQCTVQQMVKNISDFFRLCHTQAHRLSTNTNIDCMRRNLFVFVVLRFSPDYLKSYSSLSIPNEVSQQLHFVLLTVMPLKYIAFAGRVV